MSVAETVAVAVLLMVLIFFWLVWVWFSDRFFSATTRIYRTIPRLSTIICDFFQMANLILPLIWRNSLIFR